MGNINTEEEEKAEVLNAFFTSVFNSETSYPQGTQPAELEDGAGCRINAPQFPVPSLLLSVLTVAPVLDVPLL